MMTSLRKNTSNMEIETRGLIVGDGARKWDIKQDLNRGKSAAGEECLSIERDRKLFCILPRVLDLGPVGLRVERRQKARDTVTVNSVLKLCL